MNSRGPTGWVVVGLAVALANGCWQPSAHTISRNYSYREFPVDPPPGPHTEKKVPFDEVARGGELFKMYCGSCHNARPLGERPFANYEVAMAHMREQAYLTGKEYRQLIHFLRRWHEVGPPTPETEPSPRRFHFAQPISELRKEAKEGGNQPAGPEQPQ